MDQDLPLEDIAVETTEIPAGRQIKPIGSMYLASQKAINLMTDSELNEHIQNYKRMVYSAEQTLDYRRTVLSHAVNEAEHREDKIRRHLRNTRVILNGLNIAVKQDASPKEKWNGVIEKLRVSGKTDAEIATLLKDLNQLVQRSNKG